MIKNPGQKKESSLQRSTQTAFPVNLEAGRTRVKDIGGRLARKTTTSKGDKKKQERIIRTRPAAGTSQNWGGDRETINSEVARTGRPRDSKGGVEEGRGRGKQGISS